MISGRGEMAKGSFRGTNWAAAVGGLVVTAVLAGSGVVANAAETGPQPRAVGVHLAYSCRFPSGPRQVGVAVAATLPVSAASGKPIQPTGLDTTVTLPHAALADLTQGGAAQVTGSDMLGTAVGSGAGTSATVRWLGQMVRPVPIPATGGLWLPMHGRAPPVTASAPGPVTFTAAGLALSLTPGKPGTAAGTSATVQVACTLNPGQRATLGTVPVIGPVSSPAPSPSHTSAVRRAKGAPTADSTVSGIPPGCAKRLIKGGTPSPTLGCAFLIGYADVSKLRGAALVGRGPNGTPPAAFLHADTYATDVGCVPAEPTLAKCFSSHGALHVYFCTAAQLDFHRQLSFPPAQATFLAFGFTPVTAVVQLSETAWPSNHPPVEDPRCYQGFSPSKPVSLHSPLISVFSNTNNSVASQPVVSIGTTYLLIHVSQVAVNGVPLDVGQHCGTAQPMRAVLTGRGTNSPVSGYTLALGGPLTGEVTIPSFVNCGVGENLDPLLTASISGPANFQLITQGTLCTPQQVGQPGCPPTIPKPLRHV
jgi:hypothetical protein